MNEAKINRRSFVQLVGSGALAAAIAGKLSAAKSETGTKVVEPVVLSTLGSGRATGARAQAIPSAGPEGHVRGSPDPHPERRPVVRVRAPTGRPRHVRGGRTRLVRDRPACDTDPRRDRSPGHGPARNLVAQPDALALAQPIAQPVAHCQREPVALALAITQPVPVCDADADRDPQAIAILRGAVTVAVERSVRRPHAMPGPRRLLDLHGAIG